MADLSTYKGLELPKSPERYDIQVFNKNNMIIDSELHKLDLKNTSQDNLLATKEALNSEVIRATTKETDIAKKLNDETARAKAAEEANANNISEEQSRASSREDIIESNFNAEAQIMRQLIDTAYASANGYTNTKIAQLINGAPATLDTLKEIADALEDNADVVSALNEAIGKKASAAEFDSHVKDKANPHKVKATQAEAVSFSESQELSEMQKATARSNIGAGTSSFSGK